MNSMLTKFQSSILINKKVFKKGGPSAPQKGRIVAYVRVNPNAGLSFFSKYAYKISTLYLDNKKVEPSAPREARFVALGGLTHTYAYDCILYCMNILHTNFQSSILINKKY